MRKFIGYILVIFLGWFLLPVLLLKLTGIIPVLSMYSAKPGTAERIFAIPLIICGLHISLKSILLYYGFSRSVPFPLVKPNRIITEDLFAHSRNPLLIGLVIYIFGRLLLRTGIIGSLIVIFTFISISVCYLLLIKEKMLAKWFPADYAKYKKNTPLLWRFKPKEVDDVGWLKIIAYPLLASITNKVFHVEIKGLENIPKSGGALIVPNHLSYPDPFFVGANIPRNIRYLTTAEVFRSPKNKFLLTQMGSIPIKRFTEDPAGLIKMFRFLRRGRVVGYFPEGMRSWDGSPSPFPNGVAKVLRKIHVPIIPVSVSGLYAVMPRWTNKWRRARLTITYHEPFVIEKNWTDAELENRLSDLLHREEIETEPVIYTTKHLIEGLTRLLWRCPICGSIKSLEEYLPNKMSCNSCHGRWTLQQNHMLCYADSQHTEQIDSKIAGWVKRMEKFPLPDFVEGETYYPLHNSECELARGNYPDFKVLDTGKFYLTREYLEFRGSAMTELWKLSDIKVISAEGNRKLQLTLPEYQLQFTMKNDSILMWDRILTKVTNA